MKTLFTTIMVLSILGSFGMVLPSGSVEDPSAEINLSFSTDPKQELAELQPSILSLA